MEGERSRGTAAASAGATVQALRCYDRGMVDFLSEVLDALLTSDPVVRRALRENRELDERHAERTEEVALLERHVQKLETHIGALQRTVATLADVLLRSGALSEADRRQLVRAARPPASNDVEAERDVVASPYRDAVPVDSRACTRCGKVLGADDPELSLASGSKVCTLCFSRGA